MVRSMVKELLTLLEGNARYSTQDLADLLGTDKAEVEKEITRCEEEKIIAGYHTVINWDKADTEIAKAIIAVNCVPERETGYDTLAERIARYPEVDSLYLLSGKAEFLLQVNARTMREISNFIAHKLAPTEGVTGTETMFIMKEYKVSGITLSEDREDGERLLVTP